MAVSTPYQVLVYPKITALSSQRSGSNGGQTLTITGVGFDASNCAAHSVMLQGVTCAVTACTATTLSCTVGPAPAQPLQGGPYATTRGLLHRIYWNSASHSMGSFTSNPNYPNYPSVTRVQGDALQGFCVNCALFYGEQMEGLFVPKATAYHKFYISSDDASDLFLSTSNSPAIMSRIAYCNGYMPHYWVLPATQISAPILLQAGKPYFIRARHSQGNGGDFMNVAVRVVDPPARSDMETRMHSVQERQTISITTSVWREIQQVNFTRASGRFMFYLDLFGKRSAAVTTTSSKSDLEDAVAVS
jgi:hypothetical protein